VRDSNRTHSVLAVESDFVGQQARAVLGDMNVAAIKIGAVGAPASALALAVILSDYPDLPVVFDPRLTASDEEGALENSADDDATHVRAWRALLPRARVCTLSLALARRWIGLLEDANSAAPLAPHECARQLLQWGARAVFLTAAASDNGRIVNQLFDGGVAGDGATQNESIDWIDATFSGAGDTLSAAIAALLALGLELGDAVREANDFLAQALAAGYRAGLGHAVPDRMFWAANEGGDGEDATAASPTEPSPPSLAAPPSSPSS
jgi:hydroxymethylpyrimidine/phosphomethylpyrimidine kinase